MTGPRRNPGDGCPCRPFLGVGEPGGQARATDDVGFFKTILIVLSGG